MSESRLLEDVILVLSAFKPGCVKYRLVNGLHTLFILSPLGELGDLRIVDHKSAPTRTKKFDDVLLYFASPRSIVHLRSQDSWRRSVISLRPCYVEHLLYTSFLLPEIAHSLTANREEERIDCSKPDRNATESAQDTWHQFHVVVVMHI